jgi:hypothetical protein
MYNSPRRRGGSNQLADVRARRVPADDHRGSYGMFLRRHRRESATAAHGTRKAQAKFAECLFRRAADSRNLRCAIDELASEAGPAPGPNGLTFEQLGQQGRWEMARVLGKSISKGTYRPGPDRQVRIPKSSGKGTRTIRVQNIEDRVVQRAIVQVLQPFLDPRFRPTSFGYRPGLKREHALAMAGRIAARDGAWTWVLNDIKDAFDQVPHDRLLQILGHHQVPADLVELVRIVIAGSARRGLRQGGSLSPLLLNVYLDHTLDHPWRKRRPGESLIRYADDLLIPTRDAVQASDADSHLRSLLLPAGMPLKNHPQSAVQDLETGRPIDWIGYSIQKRPDGLVILPSERSWRSLTQHLESTHTKPDAPIRAIETIEGWIAQHGPCRRQLGLEDFHARIKILANELAFEEIPSLERIERLLDKACTTWDDLYKNALEQT